MSSVEGMKDSLRLRRSHCQTKTAEGAEEMNRCYPKKRDILKIENELTEHLYLLRSVLSLCWNKTGVFFRPRCNSANANSHLPCCPVLTASQSKGNVLVGNKSNCSTKRFNGAERLVKIELSIIIILALLKQIHHQPDQQGIKQLFGNFLLEALVGETLPPSWERSS